MKKKYKQRIAKLAIEILEHSNNNNKIDGGVKFDMSTFMADNRGYSIDEVKIPECGTSCCFAGYAPSVFPYTKKLKEWKDVVNFITGNKKFFWDADPVSDFLFSNSWSNNIKQAASRALYVLENEEKFMDDEYISRSDNFYTSFSKDKLIERLNKFL
jgi:hypothetical protein